MVLKCFSDFIIPMLPLKVKGMYPYKEHFNDQHRNKLSV